MKRTACRHCKERVASRGRRGVGSANDHGRPLPEPTEAIQGTEAKIAVLMRRAEREEQLFHPDDGPGGRR